MPSSPWPEFRALLNHRDRRGCSQERQRKEQHFNERKGKTRDGWALRTDTKPPSLHYSRFNLFTQVVLMSAFLQLITFRPAEPVVRKNWNHISQNFSHRVVTATSLKSRCLCFQSLCVGDEWLIKIKAQANVLFMLQEMGVSSTLLPFKDNMIPFKCLSPHEGSDLKSLHSIDFTSGYFQVITTGSSSG